MASKFETHTGTRTRGRGRWKPSPKITKLHGRPLRAAGLWTTRQNAAPAAVHRDRNRICSERQHHTNVTPQEWALSSGTGAKTDGRHLCY